MNTYNDNLRSSVISSLNSQGIDRKKIMARLNASMFKLYYAQGRKVTASEKLEVATKVQDFKRKVKEQAVENSNISTNLLMSSNQLKKNMEKSVNNSAVCAANLQTAANAIVKLASDIGSINSITAAADFDEPFSQQYSDALSLISKTAYKAELASKTGMEASTLTAEVISNAVASSANATNVSVDNLLKVVSAEFDTVSETVAADNSVVASARTKEKSAEGSLEDVNAECMAIVKAYNSTNEELNINLNVTPSAEKVRWELDILIDVKSLVKETITWLENASEEEIKKIEEELKKDLGVWEKLLALIIEGIELIGEKLSVEILKLAVIEIDKKIVSLSNDLNSENHYIVTFDCLKDPFPKDKFGPVSSTKSEQIVNGYYILLVKEEKKSTFSITEANHLKQINDQRICKVEADKDATSITKSVNIYELYDSDNEQLKRGEKYVVFIMAEFNTDYKQYLNNYNNFLSAPSLPFILTYNLVSPEVENFWFKNTYRIVEKLNFLLIAQKLIENIIPITPALAKDDNLVAKFKILETLLKSFIKTITLVKGDKIVSNGELNKAVKEIQTEIDKTSLGESDHNENVFPADSEDLIKIHNYFKTKFGDSIKIGVSFEFKIETNVNTNLDPEYRCMLMPADPKLIDGLLTAEKLPTVKSEAFEIEKINTKYDGDISDTQSLISISKKTLGLKPYLEGIIEKLPLLSEIEKEGLIKLESEVKKIISTIKFWDHSNGKTSKEILEAAIVLIAAESPKIERNIPGLTAKLQSYQHNKSVDLSLVNQILETTPRLFFNLQLAEHVSAANYIPSKSFKPSTENESNSTGNDPVPPYIFYQAPIISDTTDNFGNLLIDKNTYVPVVLTYSKDSDEAPDKYINALSDYANTKLKFTYHEPKIKK